VSSVDKDALQKQGASELVERARNFDQNSMAILKEVADNAARGDPTAQSALAHVKRYIAEHPVQDSESTADPHGESARCLGVLKDPRNAPATVLKALANLPTVGVREDVTTACSILAVGPALTGEYLAAICEAAGPWKSTVKFGIECAGDEAQLGQANREVTPKGGAGYLCAGHCLGMAARIQQAANGNVGAIGPEVAWEMGAAG
jgi:hypothetical protein